MSWESVKLATIAAGARTLNTNLKLVGTPITNLFDEGGIHQFIKPGREVAGMVLYKDELTQNLKNSNTPDREEPIDPYEGFSMPWRWTQVVYTVDGFEVENNLGGLTIEEVQNNPALLRDMGAGSLNTLINRLAPRFNNMQLSHRKKKEKDFLMKSSSKEFGEGPDGIDVITEPDSEYAGIKYDQLGTSDWKSDLMGMTVPLWNPLHKDLGSSPITREHYVNAATDLQKMSNTLITVDADKPWTYFVVSTNRYNNGVLKEWFANRRVNSSTDTEMTPTEEYMDSVHRIKFLVSPLMTNDNITYFFQGGSIKRAAQRKRTPADNLVVEKAYGRRRLKISMREQYQYRTDQRWCTGWIKGTI